MGRLLINTSDRLVEICRNVKTTALSISYIRRPTCWLLGGHLEMPHRRRPVGDIMS